MSEAAFKQEIEHTIEIYKWLIGPAATLTRQMLDRYGSEIKALSHLVVTLTFNRDSSSLSHFEFAYRNGIFVYKLRFR